MRTVLRRLRNFGVFIGAYAQALTHARRRSSGAPERILVIPAGKLGDVVCTTPVMRALRQHLPDAKLYVREFGGTNEPLLADSGLADAYLDPRDAAEYVDMLRRERIDTVILTGPSLEDVAAALLARVPRIIAPRIIGGESPQQTRPYLWLLPFAETYPYRMETYAPRERLRALEPLRIHASDTTKHLGFSEEGRRAAAAFLEAQRLAPRSYAVISPAAGNKIKQWSADRFARVAEHLIARGIPVVLIGTKRDRGEVDAMKDALADSSSVADASEKLSLDELKALIADAVLFISVDTGPLYIAEAFGVSTIDITGPIDEREQPPIGPRNRVVVPPVRTKPQLFVLNARRYDEAEAIRQVESITVEMVTQEVDSLLASLREPA